MNSTSPQRLTPKVDNECTTLLAVLQNEFGGKLNLARIKFLTLMLKALCKVQTVNFERLAIGFDSTSKSSSSLRRIQRFVAGFDLCEDLISKFIFRLLPDNNHVGLSMDRTNWKFGKSDINILALGITYKGVAFPLMFKLLPKFGNSNTDERIELMEKFDRLIGFSKINFLVADREFIGKHWLDYLNLNQISYHIRIRENFLVTLPKDGRKVRASWLFSGLKQGQVQHYSRIVIINDVLCYLSASVIKSKTGQPEYQFLISFKKPENALECYKDRWQIETMFRAMKTSGFNIEKTHLTDVDRVLKLLLIVSIAFTWAYLVGDFLHKDIKPIPIKKHGRKAKSVFKHGLDYIANNLLNTHFKEDINIFKFLSCT
jgi:hypothetical protein